MPLYDRAFLVCQTSSIGEDADPRTATFELAIEFEPSTNLNKDYLIGNFGQKLDEARRLIDKPEDFAIDGDLKGRRVGFSVDAGAGTWSHTLQFETGLEDVVWGDGSGGEGQDNVTEFDASGEGVHPVARKQVLMYWLAKSRSDSFGNAQVHYGEWTDGSIPNVDDSSIDAGAYGEPFPVAITEAEFRKSTDEVNSFTGNITMRRTQVFPNLDDAEEKIADIADTVQGFATDAAGLIPDE